jgi:hypothetical protein
MVISSQLKNMEWLLLLLLSSAAAGAVAYFFRDNAQDVSSVSPKEKEQESKKKLIEQENLENLGARSSPQLPEAKQKIRFSVEKSDLEKFKDYIKKVPSPIQPEVIQTDDLKKTLQDVKQDRYRKKKPLKVTYTTDEIIPRMSPFSRHRRPLQNAEKFVEEQKAKEALSIYERLLKRIPDEEIKQKIQKNIDDIKRWLLGLDEDEETIEFPEIIIPLTAQTVAIEKFNEGLKQISEDIAREIAKAFADGIKDIKATLNVSDAKIEAKEIKAQQFNAEAKEIKSEKFLVGESNIVGSDTGADRVIEAKEVRAEKLRVGGAGGVGDGAGGGGAGGIGADRVIEAKEVRAEKLSVGGAGGGGSGGIGADRVIEAKEVRADKLRVGGAGGVGGGAGGIGAGRVIEAKEVRAEKLRVGGAGGVGGGAGGGGAGGIGADRVIEAKEVRAEKLRVGGAGGVGGGAGGGGAGGIGADRVIEAKEVRAEKLRVGGAGGVGDGAGGGGSGGIGADRVIEAKEVRADKLSVGGAGGISTGKKEETQTSIEKKEIIISRSKEPEELSPKAPHTVYYIVPSFVRKIPKTIQKQKGIPEIEQAEIPLPIGPKVPTMPEEYFQSILTKEGFQFDEEGNLITDGWTDKDFDREWEKYKHLPLIDRRSGLDRRKEFDFDPSRPDRRSGEDRRKINLFEEREKFLEKYLKHLERKEILEKYKDFQNNKELSVYETPETKENIVISIPPSAEELGLEELEEIELPEPISEKFEDLQESIKTIQIDVEPISDEIEKEEKSEVEITPSITSGTLDSEKLEEQEEIELEELNLPEAESQENDMLSLEIPEIEPIEIQETTQEPEKEGIPYPKVEIIEPPINLEELNLPDPEEIIVEELEQKSFPSMPQQEYPQPLQEQQEQTEALQKPEKPEEGMPQPQEPSLEPKQEQLSEGVEELDFPDVPEAPEKKGPVQEIRGVLELKPPDEDDAPFLTLTYDFSKIPDSFQLSKNYHTLEYVYYKYKPLLIKAQEFARRKMLKNALNYYRMIKSQNIPPEFKRMINRNIQDITDYIEKFMMSRTND